MASTTDPRASGFDAAEFRDAIKFAMEMGMPDDEDQRIKFVFEKQVTFDAADETDSTGTPYDLTATPILTNSAYEEVEVPYAMEFVSRASQGRDTGMGFILPSRVEVYIQDTYIDEVREADYALIDGNRYEIRNWSPPLGLFDATIYSASLQAIDES